MARGTQVKHPTPVYTHRTIKFSSGSPRRRNLATHMAYFKIGNGHGADVFFAMPFKGNVLPKKVLPFYQPVSNTLEDFVEREENPVQLVLGSLKSFLSTTAHNELWLSEDDDYRNNLVAFVGTPSPDITNEREFAAAVATDIVNLMNEAHNNHENKYKAYPWILSPLIIPKNICLALNGVCYDESNVWDILDLLFDFRDTPRNWPLVLQDDETLRMVYGSSTSTEDAKQKLIALKENYSNTILAE